LIYQLIYQSFFDAHPHVKTPAPRVPVELARHPRLRLDKRQRRARAASPWMLDISSHQPDIEQRRIHLSLIDRRIRQS